MAKIPPKAPPKAQTTAAPASKTAPRPKLSQIRDLVDKAEELLAAGNLDAAHNLASAAVEESKQIIKDINEFLPKLYVDRYDNKAHIANLSQHLVEVKSLQNQAVQILQKFGTETDRTAHTIKDSAKWLLRSGRQTLHIFSDTADGILERMGLIKRPPEDK